MVVDLDLARSSPSVGTPTRSCNLNFSHMPSSIQQGSPETIHVHGIQLFSLTVRTGNFHDHSPFDDAPPKGRPDQGTLHFPLHGMPRAWACEVAGKSPCCRHNRSPDWTLWRRWCLACSRGNTHGSVHTLHHDDTHHMGAFIHCIMITLITWFVRSIASVQGMDYCLHIPLLTYEHACMSYYHIQDSRTCLHQCFTFTNGQYRHRGHQK